MNTYCSWFRNLPSTTQHSIFTKYQLVFWPHFFHHQQYGSLRSHKNWPPLLTTKKLAKPCGFKTSCWAETSKNDGHFWSQKTTTTELHQVLVLKLRNWKLQNCAPFVFDEKKTVIFSQGKKINRPGFTLPETNIDPVNRPLEKEIPIGNHHF